MQKKLLLALCAAGLLPQTGMAEVTGAEVGFHYSTFADADANDMNKATLGGALEYAFAPQFTAQADLSQRYYGLTNWDGTTFTLHGSYDAAKSAASQASVNALPSADDVTQAVWDESLDTHNVAGSTGAALTAAGIAGDPWTADVPGNYDVGTAGALLPALAAALSALGAGSVVVTSPVAESGTVTLHAGDDYDPADGRGLLFTVADETHALHLDEAGCVVRFKSPQVTWSAASVSTTPAGYLVMFSLTHEQTSALSITRQLYELEATQADGDIITLATGTLVVVRDIPAVG